MVTVEHHYEVLSCSLQVDTVGARNRSGGDNTVPVYIIKPSVLE